MGKIGTKKRMMSLLLALVLLLGITGISSATLLEAEAESTDVEIRDWVYSADYTIRLGIHTGEVYKKSLSNWLNMDQSAYSKLRSATYTISFDGTAMDLAANATLGQSPDYYAQFYNITTTKNSPGNYTVAITPKVENTKLPKMGQSAAVIDYDVKMTNESKLADMVSVPVTVTAVSVECIKEADGTVATLTPNKSVVTTFRAAWKINLDMDGGTARHDFVNVVPGNYYGRIAFEGENGFMVRMPVPSKTGYVFDGWYTTPKAVGGGEKIEIIGTPAPEKASMPTTLYARWTKTTADVPTGGKVQWVGQTKIVDKDTLEDGDIVTLQTKLYVDPSKWSAFSCANLTLAFDTKVLEFVSSDYGSSDIMPFDMTMENGTVNSIAASLSYAFAKSDGYILTATYTMKVLDAKTIKEDGGRVNVSYFNEDAGFFGDDSTNGSIDRMELVDAGTAATLQPTTFTPMLLKAVSNVVSISGSGTEVLKGNWADETTGTLTFYVKKGDEAYTSTDGLAIKAELAGGFSESSEYALSGFTTPGALKYVGKDLDDKTGYGKFTYTYTAVKSSVIKLTPTFNGEASDAVFYLVVPGDANKSTAVNSGDVTLLKKYVNGYLTATQGSGDFVFELCDVNESNEINSGDVTLLKKMVNGYITSN